MFTSLKPWWGGGGEGVKARPGTCSRIRGLTTMVMMITINDDDNDNDNDNGNVNGDGKDNGCRQ